MKGIYTLCADAASAQNVADALEALGIVQSDIVILSSEPIERYEIGKRDRETWMPQLALFGATVGLIVAYLLTSLTQKAWPLNTGGMPIVSFYANMVPLFELMMLGGVLGTVSTLFVTARLGRRRTVFSDPEVSNGKILVGVLNPSQDILRDVEETLKLSDMGEFRRTADA